MTREILRHVLTKIEGFTVVGTAPDGESGLKMALELCPDVICLDMFLPKLSGLKVLEQLNVHLPGATVIIISGSDDEDSRLAALKLGAVGYITKPFQYETLQALLEQTIREARFLAQSPRSG